MRSHKNEPPHGHNNKCNAKQGCDNILQAVNNNYNNYMLMRVSSFILNL